MTPSRPLTTMVERLRWFWPVAGGGIGRNVVRVLAAASKAKI